MRRLFALATVLLLAVPAWADWDDGDCIRCDLEGAGLNSAILIDANLYGANLVNADLSGPSLVEATSERSP